MAIPRFQVVPAADHQAVFQVNGEEKTRWHFGQQYPRPFFYPVLGPSGVSLTRMGHPGDSGHDHHRSVWFAHHDVAGRDFWSEHGNTRIQQRRWLCYQDGDDEAALAAELLWLDSQGSALLRQELVAAVRQSVGMHPLPQGEWVLELQSTWMPAEKSTAIELGQTNFGFLAVRMAKTVSAYFGGGRIRSSEGREGETEIFGQQASWMDYSGPVTANAIEGVTYFDHPANPGYPAAWHVREDGWMGASFNRTGKSQITSQDPLQLRYLLHVHAGECSPAAASNVAANFGHLPAWEVVKSNRKHVGHEIKRP